LCRRALRGLHPAGARIRCSARRLAAAPRSPARSQAAGERCWARVASADCAKLPNFQPAPLGGRERVAESGAAPSFALYLAGSPNPALPGSVTGSIASVVLS
jgi:hypothetical protein